MKDTSVHSGSSQEAETHQLLKQRIIHIYRYTSRTVNQVLEDDKGRKAEAEWLIVKFRGMADGPRA